MFLRWGGLQHDRLCVGAQVLCRFYLNLMQYVNLAKMKQ